MRKPLSRHPYASFLHQVSTPNRYIGGEFGAVDPDWESAEASFVLVFPDVYEVGMSHLGSQILLDCLGREPGIVAERCFAPWPDLEAILRDRGIPLVSLESWTPLAGFDVLGFSLQHELSYTNVLTVLDLARVPLRAAGRTDRDPIVLGGGPCALRPAPISPFFDALFVGEAEAHIGPIVRLVGRMRRAGAARADILLALADSPGILCPSLPRRVRRVFVRDLDAFPIPTRAVVPWGRAVFDRATVELSRGCSEGCRFCEAGYTYRPLRDRRPTRVVDSAIRAVQACGHDELSLCSLSPADHPTLGPIVQALAGSLSPAGVTLSVSSLRAYGLAESVLRDLRGVRAAGLTLAPEAGSRRLRDVINKNVQEDDLIEATRRAFASGWQRLKLYFMIGLPTETDEDVLEIARLAKTVAKLGRSLTSRVRVTASVGVFVPRPHTPFQWEPMAGAEVLGRRRDLLRQALAHGGVDLKIADFRMSFLECALARGDGRTADVVEAAHRLGCRFDNWEDRVRYDLWEAAFAAAGVDPAEARRQLPLEGPLPWDLVDPLVTREFLLRERERALAGRPLAPCEKPSPRLGQRGEIAAFLAARAAICYHCGSGCDGRAIAEDRRATIADGDRLSPETRKERQPPVAPGLWHLVFTRTGRAAYLSQKDLVKHMPRILRRAGLDLVLSGGFHPLPKIAYRQPAPVGYQSIGEWIEAEIRLPEGGAPDIERLNAASVDGLEFLSAKRVTGRCRPGLEARYAFLSPMPASHLAARLPAPLKVEALEGAVPAPLAGGDGFASVLIWPATGRPPGRPHEILGALSGCDMRPFDFVRLYDDPRG